jgi:hypothetical protein
MSRPEGRILRELDVIRNLILGSIPLEPHGELPPAWAARIQDCADRIRHAAAERAEPGRGPTTPGSRSAARTAPAAGSRRGR